MLEKNLFSLSPHPAKKERIFTVYELTRNIQSLIEGNFPLRIGVEGEISNLRAASTGHIYFTLKDPFAQLRAVFFREAASRLKIRMEEGMKVVVWGRLRVYTGRGIYQLIGEEIEKQGIGILYTRYLQLKEKLEKEGLFEEAMKKPLPPYPRTIGLVTSPTGAAVKDMIKVITRRFPRVHIIIYPVRVQGEEAAEEIAHGIQVLNQMKEAEVIIVGRGGGSVEDLWAFNEETVARAIATSRIPIISAVGHEQDYCISDFVADKRAPTPSAAGEMVVVEMEKLVERLEDSLNRLNSRMFLELINMQEKLQKLTRALLLQHPRKTLEREKEKLAELHLHLFRRMQTITRNSQEKLASWAGKLEALSPLKVLERGYSITFLLPSGKILRESREVKKGAEVKVKLWKGNLFCQVLKKEDESITPS